MRTKIGDKFASITLNTKDENVEQGIYNLLASFNRSRRAETGTRSDDDALGVYLLYCTYVSRNIGWLDPEGYDPVFDVEDIGINMGESYVAGEFLAHYSNLRSMVCALPELDVTSLRTPLLSLAINEWSRALEGSPLSLVDDGGFDIAHAIARALMHLQNAGRWEEESYGGVAELVSGLADVKGKRVCDPACGNGAFLAAAMLDGATSVSGVDLNSSAVMRAKIISFFANPTGGTEIVQGDGLYPAIPCEETFDRVLCAPPLSARADRMGRDKAETFRWVREKTSGTLEAAPRDIEDLFVLQALSSLDEDGVAVVHISPSFLFNVQKSRQDLRRWLVERGYVSAVVELPGGCVPGSMVKSALLVLTKRPRWENILLVDADSKDLSDKEFFTKSRRFSVPTRKGIEWIVDTVNNRREVPRVSMLVSRDEVSRSGANLCYSNYGTVYDVEAALESTRPAREITNDIETVQKSVDRLNESITDIVAGLARL